MATSKSMEELRSMDSQREKASWSIQKARFTSVSGLHGDLHNYSKAPPPPCALLHSTPQNLKSKISKVVQRGQSRLAGL